MQSLSSNIVMMVDVTFLLFIAIPVFSVTANAMQITLANNSPAEAAPFSQDGAL